MFKVIIDHSSRLGFECIAEARQYLLGMGAKEVEDSTTADWEIRGSYVVAPVSFNQNVQFIGIDQA